MRNILKGIRFFSSFSDEQLSELEKISRIKKLDAGEILFYEDDPSINIYFLNKGFLRILKNQAELKQVHIHTMGPGNFIAEITIFQTMNYPATTEALQECEIVAINKKQFMEKFFGDVSLLQEMLKSLSMKVNYLMKSIERETIITKDLKIAKFILDHTANIGKIKNKDIAFELNTTSETVSRILKKFQKNGLLESTSPIKIKDIEGIRLLCN